MIKTGFSQLPFLAVGSGLLLLGIAVLVRERGRFVSLLFLIVSLFGAAWQLSYVGLFQATDAASALRWARIENVAVVFIPSAVLLFSLGLTHQIHRYRLLLFGSWTISSLFCLMVLTTDLFIEGVRRYSWGYFARYGTWTPPFLLFFFFLLLFSLRLYWVEYRHATSLTQRHRMRAMMTAFGIAYLGSMDYLPAYGIPIYPAGYLPIFLFSALVARTIWKYRLVEITPAFAAKQILKTMADSLLVVDREGIIRLANRAASQLFGQTEEELVGKPLWSVSNQFLPGERFKTLIRTKVVQSYETTVSEKEGQPVILDVSASSLRDEKDQTVGILCIARDKTERKQAEKDLEKAHQELKKSHEDLKNTQIQLIQAVKMESIGRLAAGVAHEVKNPLAVILQGIEYLSGRAANREENSALVLDYTKEAVRRADSVIKGMLDFSRTQGLEMEEADLHQAIEQALLLVKHELDKNHITLVKQFTPSPPLFLLDCTKIEQVFVNLFMNAIQAMPGGGALTVRTIRRQFRDREAVHHAGERTRERFWAGDPVGIVEITDTGAGIPEAILHKIFDPFFTTKPTGQGTGLGLTVTKAILDMHGATLDIFNRSEGGVQVTLMFKAQGGGSRDQETDPSHRRRAVVHSSVETQSGENRDL